MENEKYNDIVRLIEQKAITLSLIFDPQVKKDMRDDIRKLIDEAINIKRNGRITRDI